MRKLIAIAISIYSSAALAQQSPQHDPARLFPLRADLEVDRDASLTRLPLPARVIEESRPDLADVRVHDSEGGEVPYLVDSGARPFAHDTPTEILLQPLEVQRETTRLPSIRYRERLVAPIPPAAPLAAHWDLVLSSYAPNFVGRAVVTRIHGTERQELVRQSIFRLIDPLRERMSIPLPVLEVSGDDRLEIAIESDQGYLSPQLRLRADRSSPLAPTLVIALEEIGRQHANGRTIVELVRPPGLTPDRLRITTSSGHFHRAVYALDVRQGRAPVPIGEGSIFRVAEIEGAESVDVDVGPTRGDLVRIEINDGDSPALDELRIEGVVRQPVLIFEARQARALLFGGGRAHAPRYDLQDLFGTSSIEALLARALPEAHLGEIVPNPRFDDGPALRFAMRAGRNVDAASYTHRARVVVHDARDGLSRIVLPVAVLAIASEDAADVRIVDEQGHQWPYLRASDPVHASIDPRIEGPRAEGSRSHFTFALPVERALVDRLTLRPDVPYMRRSFELVGLIDDRRITLTRGELHREPDDVRPIEIAFDPTRVERLELIVEDGNDAPIRLDAVEIAAPSYALFLAAPDGSYRLLAGDPSAEAPQYEIAQASALVLSVAAVDATVSALEANPAHVPPPWYARLEVGSYVVWIVLLLAVLILAGLTLRVARAKEEPPEETKPGEKSETAPAPDKSAETTTPEDSGGTDEAA